MDRYTPDPAASAQLRLAGRRKDQEIIMLKFIGGTVGIIFLIGLLVVIGIFALIF